MPRSGFGKEFNVAVLKEALYKPIVRPGKEQYPATLKLKILTKSDGSFVPESYNMQKQPVPLDSIEKGQKACAIIDLNQIWFIDNKFGVTIRLQTGSLRAVCQAPLPFAFQGLDLPEEEEVEVEEEDEIEEVDDQ